MSSPGSKLMGARVNTLAPFFYGVTNEKISIRTVTGTDWHIIHVGLWSVIDGDLERTC